MLLHRGPFHQKGTGLGGFFKSLFASARPLLRKAFQIGKKAVKHPVVQDTIQDAKDTALQVGVSTVSDLLKGEDVQQSIFKNSGEAKRHLSERLADRIDSFSKKRKLENNTVMKKKKKKRDIFDSDFED